VSKVTTYFNYSAEHAWITDYWGNACGYKGDPYINNCGLDFAGKFLQDAFEGLALKWNSTRGAYDKARMLPFNFGAFGASSSISLDTTGYAYVPAQCKNGSSTMCHLHVNFHGCGQMRSHFPFDPTEYVAHTGLNQWAESNNVVVLYPQTVAQPLKGNQEGCFDWWGYCGAGYATKNGAQMKVVASAVKMLLGK
jgi:hypothetical protein